MSSLSDALQAYEEAPRPLTDEERRLLKRMFSDYFEVPAEWKRELRADLERDPPILGKQTLGSSGAGSKLPPENLASGGMFGSSGVGYLNHALTFDYPTGPSIRSFASNPNRLDLYADEIHLGKALQDIIISRGGANRLNLEVDILYWGSNKDVRWTRQGAEDVWLESHRLNLTKAAGINETPLIVNVGGVLKNVLVGPNNSAGGIGRQLYVVNS